MWIQWRLTPGWSEFPPLSQVGEEWRHARSDVIAMVGEVHEGASRVDGGLKSEKAPERISVQNPASDGDKLRSSTGAEFCESLVFSIMWIQVFWMHLKYQDVFHSIFAGRFLPPAFFEQPDVVVMRDKTTWATKNIQQKSGKSLHFPPISSSPFFIGKNLPIFFWQLGSTRPP